MFFHSQLKPDIFFLPIPEPDYFFKKSSSDPKYCMASLCPSLRATPTPTALPLAVFKKIEKICPQILMLKLHKFTVVCTLPMLVYLPQNPGKRFGI